MTLPGTRTSRATATGPLVNASALGGSATNNITAGGASQVLIAEAADRAYFFFQNISAGTMWLGFGVAAVADTPSIKVIAGASFTMEDNFVSGDAVNVLGTTTGDKYVCKAG